MPSEDRAFSPPDDASTARGGTFAAPRRRVVILSLATVLALGAWASFLLDPFYQERIRTLLAGRGTAHAPAPHMDFAVHEARDPQIGDPLPDTAAARDIRRKAGASKGGYLLAALGSCDSCTSLSLRKLYEQARPRGILVL